ncbi:serine/threonine protein kinase [Streptomyces sp. CJ_13]|uniref:serine/threonine-protein kinase n=1 Tax=Streptomyces sp. CJ_13 TaxID=2724943 RepID=UPI001BDD95A5|nr:serine/threonine-protein kinase [Streptomyces sp. CJ_13]MBT1182869.1 serine/threonine protein kinase [Streptomyces sp. CJ_13]
MESLQPGDPPEIGGYRLLARLGAGGMGEVFLARTASGRPLALKTVHRDLSLEPGFAERFAREIRTNDRVRSPWTVSVVDFSPPGAAPQWLATEYVAAPSLGDWVRAHGPLAEPAVRCLAQELTAALVAVRAAGVVHRDIKPANVLLGPQRPFLIDFGIARAVRDPRSTQTGAVIGTPGYLAPEQATGSVAEAPADVFALASVLVYAATGHGPFQEHGEELGLPALLYRIVHDEPLLGEVPEALVPLVRECLAKDPRQRPTAEVLRARLGAAAEEDWSGSLPAALVEDVARREAELRRLLSASQPPMSGVAAAAGTGAPPRPSAAPLSAAPGYPPTAPGTPPPSPAATAGPSGRRSSRRGRVLGAVAGVAALAAGAALLVRFHGGGDEGGSPATAASRPASPSPSPSPSASASAAGGASSPTASLPASWAGTWSGVGPGTPDANGITRARTGGFAVTVTLRAGAVGELVGKQASDVREVSSGRNLGCTEALELKQVSGNTVVLAAVTSHPTDTAATFDCPRGNLYVVTMAGPDRLTLESEGAQSAGAPSALSRRP